jgi:hypothetical protein
MMPLLSLRFRYALDIEICHHQDLRGLLTTPLTLRALCRRAHQALSRNDK